MCYIGTWAVYHKIDPFQIEDIDPFKCTHINYGFAKLDEYKYTIQMFDPYQDDNKNPYEKRMYWLKPRQLFVLIVVIDRWIRTF